MDQTGSLWYFLWRNKAVAVKMLVNVLFVGEGQITAGVLDLRGLGRYWAV